VTDKLAKAERSLAKRLDPKIVTTADPKPDWLLQARAEVNSDTSIRELFDRAKSENQSPEWLADQVSTRLMAKWGESPEQAIEAAQYLADEHFQIGEGIQVVSTETGKIVITVTEDDVYQPAPVPREGGGLATPLPRLDPSLEAFITTWVHDKAREERIVRAIVERGHKAIMLDDPRLRVATRAGRSQIVSEVSEVSPESLLRGLGGTSAAFLQRFDLRTTPPEGAAEPALAGTIEAKSVVGISDPTTVNLQHDRKATLRGVLPQGWIRELARRLGDEAHKRGPVATYALDEIPARLEGDLWVIPPEAIREFIRPGWIMIPVERARVIGLKGAKVGTLVVAESFAAESHELFERWEAVADLDFQLWVDFDAITCIGLTGLEYQAHVV
jgi:hypothetical protein